MHGDLYEEALTGQRCWLRYDDGFIKDLPVDSWLSSGEHQDREFDVAVVAMCDGPTIDLGCGPGRFVAHLTKLGIPALGVDQSQTAVDMARRSGAAALRRDVFERLPGTGRWGTVLLADGNVGLGGDPHRMLHRAGELMRSGGRCVAEFDGSIQGVHFRWVRLESATAIGPWFKWASVGIDSAASLAADVGLAVTSVIPVGNRMLANLVAA